MFLNFSWEMASIRLPVDKSGGGGNFISVCVSTCLLRSSCFYIFYPPPIHPTSSPTSLPTQLLCVLFSQSFKKTNKRKLYTYTHQKKWESDLCWSITPGHGSALQLIWLASLSWRKPWLGLYQPLSGAASWLRVGHMTILLPVVPNAGIAGINHYAWVCFLRN